MLLTKIDVLSRGMVGRWSPDPWNIARLSSRVNQYAANQNEDAILSDTDPLIRALVRQSRFPCIQDRRAEAGKQMLPKP